MINLYKLRDSYHLFEGVWLKKKSKEWQLNEKAQLVNYVTQHIFYLFKMLTENSKIYCYVNEWNESRRRISKQNQIKPEIMFWLICSLSACYSPEPQCSLNIIPLTFQNGDSSRGKRGLPLPDVHEGSRHSHNATGALRGGAL